MLARGVLRHSHSYAEWLRPVVLGSVQLLCPVNMLACSRDGVWIVLCGLFGECLVVVVSSCVVALGRSLCMIFCKWRAIQEQYVATEYRARPTSLGWRP